MQYCLIGVFLIVYGLCIGQDNEPVDVVHRFFQAMSDIDTAYLNSSTSDDLYLNSSSIKEGFGRLSSGSKSAFIASVSKAEPGIFDEQISNISVRMDDGLANIWMDYAFYLNAKFSHCGVNDFTLAKVGETWKIISIVDTRRKEDCLIDFEQSRIDELLNDWHLAAAQADSLSYFSKMTVDAIYIGTDKTEVWPKRAFTKFAAPYFKRGKAWSFTTVSRNIYSDDFKQVAWFDELLDTWMGPCRGSGVLVKDGNTWKIKHYVLSVTVPNDDIQEFIKISEK